MTRVRHVSPNSVNTLVLADRVLVRVTTGSGVPVPGIECKVTFSDGRVEKGRTDRRGVFVAPHDLAESDEVTVEFPRLPASTWRAPTPA